MITFAVIESGPGVSIHTATTFADNLDTLADAHAFIEQRGLTRVQVVADERRFLTAAEQVVLNTVIVGEAHAA